MLAPSPQHAETDIDYTSIFLKRLSCLLQGCIPLLLSLRDLVGLEPVVWDVQSAGIIVRVVWPALLAVHNTIWSEKGELVSSSGCIPLSVTVLNCLSSPSCNIKLVVVSPFVTACIRDAAALLTHMRNHARAYWSLMQFANPLRSLVCSSMQCNCTFAGKTATWS